MASTIWLSSLVGGTLLVIVELCDYRRPRHALSGLIQEQE